MGTLQSSGAISFANLQSVLGGTDPIGFDEYYRGGSNVPTEGNRDPTTGDNYSGSYGWTNVGDYSGGWTYSVVWNGSQVASGSGSYPSNPPGSVTVGSYVYYQGTYKSQVTQGTPPVTQITTYYAVYRKSSINTSVPASGQISMSNMYGAQNP